MYPHEGFVPVADEVRLRYQIVGDGADTVIVPLASYTAADLTPLAQNRRLIFYDPRGRGGSDSDSNPAHNWNDYELADLETLRRHFNLESISLIGWSYLGALSRSTPWLIQSGYAVWR
jgi:pimeloyl-ACP methyl ester carboxylesterase